MFHKDWYCIRFVADSELLRLCNAYLSVGKDPGFGCRLFIDVC